jgi:hypothetical protein
MSLFSIAPTPHPAMMEVIQIVQRVDVDKDSDARAEIAWPE